MSQVTRPRHAQESPAEQGSGLQSNTVRVYSVGRGREFLTPPLFLDRGEVYNHLAFPLVTKRCVMRKEALPTIHPVVL